MLAGSGEIASESVAKGALASGSKVKFPRSLEALVGVSGEVCKVNNMGKGELLEVVELGCSCCGI